MFGRRKLRKGLKSAAGAIGGLYKGAKKSGASRTDMISQAARSGLGGLGAASKRITDSPLAKRAMRNVGSITKGATGVAGRGLQAMRRRIAAKGGKVGATPRKGDVKALQEESEGTPFNRPPIELGKVKPSTSKTVGDPVKIYNNGGYVEGK